MKKLFKVTAPNGAELTRASEHDYSHAVIFQYGDNGYGATFHKSLKNAESAKNSMMNRNIKAINRDWFKKLEPEKQNDGTITYSAIVEVK